MEPDKQVSLEQPELSAMATAVVVLLSHYWLRQAQVVQIPASLENRADEVECPVDHL